MFFSRCPPGSREDNGACYVEAQAVAPPRVIVMCPPGSIRIGDQCQIIVDPITVPQISIRCTPPMYLEGNSCVYQVPAPVTPPVIIRCPPQSTFENNNCVFDIRAPELPRLIVRCPYGWTPEGNNCVYNVVADTPKAILPERIEKPDCCNDGSPSATTINNNNTVHAPVNVTSHNVNNIALYPGGCSKGETEYTVIRNGVTEKLPCSNQAATRPVPVDQCCTVMTPRLCTNTRGSWECGHNQYRRCGEFCNEDHVYLQPVRSTYRRNTLVMPPVSPSIQINRRRGGRVNCYGCLNGAYNCSPECFVSKLLIIVVVFKLILSYYRNMTVEVVLVLSSTKMSFVKTMEVKVVPQQTDISPKNNI